MRVKGEPVTDIPVIELQSGQVAVITKWILGGCEGTVVVRFKDVLVGVGTESYWDNVWSSNTFKDSPERFRVRVLEKGTLCEV